MILPQIEVKQRTGKKAKSCYGHFVGDTVYIVTVKSHTARVGVVKSVYSTMIDVDLRGGGNLLVRPKEREKFRVLTKRTDVITLLKSLIRGEIVKREAEIKNYQYKLEGLK